jgi:hypothetical protein
VYTTGDATTADGIVTIVDADPAPACDPVRAIEARLFAVLDDGVTVGRRPAFSDDRGVMCRASLFPWTMAVVGVTTACSRYIGRELKDFRP